MLNKSILAPLMIMGMFSWVSSSQVPKEEAFWKWFNKNEARLYDFEKEQDRIFQELSAELTKIDENLVFEFGPKEDGVRDFVISADGIKKSFPFVVSLVDKAPPFSRWKIIKFRPRRPPFPEIRYDGLSTKLDQIKFTLEPDGDKVGITIFIDGYRTAQHQKFLGIAFLYLDNCLGEFDVETKVGFIKLEAMIKPTNIEKSPLIRLPEIFDRFFTAKKN